MAKKLGLVREDEEDLEKLYNPLFQIMADVEVDYTLFFRSLSGFKCGNESVFREELTQSVSTKEKSKPGVPEKKKCLTLLLEAFSVLELKIKLTQPPLNIENPSTLQTTTMENVPENETLEDEKKVIDDQGPVIPGELLGATPVLNVVSSIDKIELCITRDQVIQRWSQWANTYKARLESESSGPLNDDTRSISMKKHNPR